MSQSSLPKRKWPRFRVLIVGRANAGKTTILNKICGATGEPVIYTPRGIRVALSSLMPSSRRGMHNIDDEMVFPSNPRFVFHDSRGFESGGTQELESVRKFIASRAKKRAVGERLHAIWYCIPVDNPRLLSAAETTFFDDCGTGEVPVIAIFTKFDHGDIDAFNALEAEGMDFEDAKREAPLRAKADFDKSHLPRLYCTKFPPQKHVYLRDMNQPLARCGELVEQTAEALQGFLKQLLVSTQRDNLEVCKKYAVTESILPYIRSFKGYEFQLEDMKYLTNQVLAWFPRDLNDLERTAEFFEKEKHGDVFWFSKNYSRYQHNRNYWETQTKTIPVLNDETDAITSDLPLLAGPHSVMNQISQLGLAITIMAEYLYSLPPPARLQNTLRIYQASPISRIVSNAVERVYPSGIRYAGENREQQLIKIALDNSL